MVRIAIKVYERVIETDVITIDTEITRIGGELYKVYTI